MAAKERKEHKDVFYNQATKEPREKGLRFKGFRGPPCAQRLTPRAFPFCVLLRLKVLSRCRRIPSASLAAGFYGGEGGEGGRELGGVEGFHLQRDEAELRHAKLGLAVGAVHDHRHAGDVPAVGANDGHRFLHAPAFGHDIFHDEDVFAGRNFEAAPQHELAFLFFHEDEPRAKLPRDFLPNDEAAHRGRDHSEGAERFDLGGERRAEFFHDGHLLQGEGALEKLPAVQAAAENEMAFEQRAGVAKNLEDFVLCHGGSFAFQVSGFKRERLKAGN